MHVEPQRPFGAASISGVITVTWLEEKKLFFNFSVEFYLLACVYVFPKMHQQTCMSFEYLCESCSIFESWVVGSDIVIIDLFFCSLGCCSH